MDEEDHHKKLTHIHYQTKMISTTSTRKKNCENL